MKTLASLSAKILAALVLTVLPAIGADTALQQIHIADGGTTAEGMRIYNLSWDAIGGATYRVQWRPNFLPASVWTTMDALTPAASGTAGTQVLVDPNGADAQQGYFRVILPAVQISELQPSTVATTGGIFYVVGQCFDATHVVKVDGLPVLATVFIDHNTLRISVGALAAGFHSVTVEDAGGTVVAALPNSLSANGTGTTNQESPPKPPLAATVVASESPTICWQLNSGISFCPPPGGFGNGLWPLPPPRASGGGIRICEVEPSKDSPGVPRLELERLGGFGGGSGGGSVKPGGIIPPTPGPNDGPSVNPFGGGGGGYFPPGGPLYCPPPGGFGNGIGPVNPPKGGGAPGPIVLPPPIGWPGAGPSIFGPDPFWPGGIGPIVWPPILPPPLPPEGIKLPLVIPPPPPPLSQAMEVHFDKDSKPPKSDGKKPTPAPLSARPAPGASAFVPPKIEPLGGMPSVTEPTGELWCENIDLVVPGRGFDFVWARSYRSKDGLDTAMGVGWDFSYNIRAQLVSPQQVVVGDGRNRLDTYFRQPDGSFVAPEIFRSGTLAGGPPVFALEFGDKSVWTFRAFDGSPAQGKIDRISDRHGNTMQFAYNAGGNLQTVIDTLGRPFQIIYSPAGRIQFVQDFMGRQLAYQHHTGAGGGGSLGDLMIARSPIVNGTPTGNDFPGGKIARFTYTAGFPDAARNHNLLTLTDGNNVQWFTANYTPANNPAQPDYDRVAAHVCGIAGETTVFHYAPQPPSPANDFATMKTIVNDPLGHVHWLLADGKNRPLELRRFTGSSTPGIPVTEVANLPTGQVRASDPPFFKTTFEWNADALPEQVVQPDNVLDGYIWQGDLEPDDDVRLRANIRVIREVPTTGAPLVTRIEHLPGFGAGGCFYNYSDTTGYVVKNITSCTAPFRDCNGGYANGCETNVASASLVVDGPGVTWPILVIDPHGFQWAADYDANGNRTSVTPPVAGTGVQFEYNPFGQRTATVLPPNHTGHSERIEFNYYNAGAQNGYLRSVVEDATGFANTTTFQYDPAGNLTSASDPGSGNPIYIWNQLNQLVRVQSSDVDPGPGVVRYETDFIYDANNNVVRVDVQNKDEFGVLGANTHFSTTITYDALDHPRTITREVDAVNSVTSRLTYDAKRNITRYESPRAVLAVEFDAVQETTFDERDMTHVMSHGLGGPDETYFKFTYDGGGRVTKLDTGAPAGPQRTMLYSYDGFRRLEKVSDPMGNETHYTYDALHRGIRAVYSGETNDIAGNAGNIALSRSHFEYDANGRCTATKLETYDYPGTYAGDGLRTTALAYDDASNVRTVTDDNGNATTFAYDTANRVSRVTDAKGSNVALTFNARSELVSKFWTLKSDSGVPDLQFQRTYSYDALYRPIGTSDNVGNTETYSYDSRGNTVRIVDARGNHAQWEFDGLSRPTRSGRDLGGNSFAFDAGDIVTLSAWDENSRLTGSTNANGFATLYAYDALARRIRTQQPDGTLATVSFDAWSRPVLATDANGTQKLHSYDDNGRVVNVNITPGPGVLATTTFEQTGYDGAGRVIHVTNNATSVLFTYDSASNLRTERQGANTLTYTYDGAGRRITTSHPGGRVYSYSYDAANLLTSVSLTATADGDALGVIATNHYVGARIERVDRRNGTFTETTYAGAVGTPIAADFGWGTVASVTHKHTGGTVVDARTFEHDRNQNLTQRFDARLGGPGLLHRHQYDAANRITGTQVTAGAAIVRQTNYALDLEGNRINVGGPGTPDAGGYTQNAANPPADAQQNQYTTSPIAGYLYDANGNRRRSGGAGGNFGYAYDARNRLIDVTDLGTGNRVVTYLYDAAGRRTRRTLAPDTAPVPLNFIHDGRAVVEERDGVGAVTASYFFCEDRSGNEGQDEQCLADGRLMGESEIWWFSHGGDNQQRPHEFISFSYRSGAGGQLPTESLSINFSIVEMRRLGVNHTFHTAGGSTFALTDGAGIAAERYEYEDFGQPHFFNGAGLALPVSAVGNPYLRRGARWNPETGLYLRTHGGDCDCACDYFDPRIGRMLNSNAATGGAGGAGGTGGSGGIVQ